MTQVFVDGSPLQTYLDDFEAFAANGQGGPPWLMPLRRAAIDIFGEIGFPTPRNEDWHFTSVAPIAEAEFRLFQHPSGEATAPDIAPFRFAPRWPTIVFLNGRYAPQLSALGSLPGGVQVRDLGSALASDDGLLRRHLTRVAGVEANAFTALNTAFLSDGAVVHVARGAEVAVPIHIMYVADADAAKSVMYPRNLIVLERQGTATVIESYVSLGDPHYFTNAVTEAVVGDSATLRHYKIQREGARAFHVGSSEAHQGRDSHYVSFSFAAGAALSRTNIYTVLDGEGCGATLNGLYMVDGDQHVDHQTRIEHAQPNCFSREMYKGILDGASHGVFNGKVFVRPVAQKTDGKQTNNNLLLSDKARVDTKPQLEIFADDVKCTHGATVGRIDEVALFYMKSRGINRRTARELLTYAFAAEVLETIEVAEVRAELERLALKRFTHEERG